MKVLKTNLLPLLVGLFISSQVLATPPVCTPQLVVENIIIESNDTVFVCQFQQFDVVDMSLIEGLLVNREFDFGNGSGPYVSNSSSIYNYSYETEGVYTMTMTVESALCASMQVSKTVVVLGQPQFATSFKDVDCAGNCNGQASVQLLTEADAYYNVQWDDPLQQQNDTAFSLCPSTYHAFISDVYGCVAGFMTSPVDVSEPQPFQVEVDAADTVYLCPASGVTGIPLNLSGGAGNNQAMWTPSPFVSVPAPDLMEFEPNEESLDQMYYVTVMDNNGCSGSDSVFIGSPSSSLMGSVTMEGQPCENCEVLRYEFNPDAGVWDIIDSELTDAVGAYDFGVVSNFQKFILMADPEDISYPMGVETFYPLKYDWSQAQVFNTCGDNLEKEIELIAPMPFDGTNTLSGTIYYSLTGKTQTEEDPIPLIDVVVEKTPPGQAQGRVATDGNGYYEFEYVRSSDTTYTIHVSIPGVPQSNTYEILADGSNQNFNNLDFCLNIDSTALETCSVEQLITSESQGSDDNGFILYPNPSNGRFSIETGKFAETDSEIRIVDPSGRMVFRKQYLSTPYVINMVNVAEGYYLVQIMNEQEADTAPISVMDY